MTTATRAPITTILTPIGMLGYGIPEQDFWQCVEDGVDMIAVDAGSTDPGPYMLGLGDTLSSDTAVRRDLRPLLRAAAERHIPVAISSAGGAGTRDQVDHLIELIDDIALTEGWSLKIGRIYADLSKEVVTERLNAGRMSPNVRGELPTIEDIQSSTGLVAQMGHEPFMEFLHGEDPVDVIVAGRAYDPAPHAAWAIGKGVQPAFAWHSGKILECGGACAEPKGGGVLTRLYDDGFDIVPMSADQRCTPLSVAAHTLYEKSRPDLLPGPAGTIDVTFCTYTEVDDRTVRVTGSQHVDALPSLKVEGAAIAGERAVFIGGIHDPTLIAQLDDFLGTVKKRLGMMHPELVSGEASLNFHVYGRDAVMGSLETSLQVPHEVGILGEVTAPTAELAKAICSIARIGVLHLPYPGQVATSGNLALPLNPMETTLGPVCRFSVYHVIGADDLDHTELFPSDRLEVGVV